MGLAANIPAVEASQAIMMSQAIAMALGDDPKLHATMTYRATGNAAMAQQVEIQGMMKRGARG